MDKQLLKKEILDIHKSFQLWYNGEIKKSDLNSTIGDRLSKNFYIVFPNAMSQSKQAFLSMLRKDYANDPSFKIKIRNIVIRPLANSFGVATYEELQYWSGKRKPQLKIRTTAVTKQVRFGFEWVAIHETKIGVDL